MKMQTLHCEAGNHEWQRPSSRGRRPRVCPDCQRNTVLMALYRSGSAKSEQIAEAQREQLSEDERTHTAQRIEQLREQVENSATQYEEMLKRAMAADDTNEIDRAFNRCDRLQRVIIASGAELRRLEKAIR